MKKTFLFAIITSIFIAITIPFLWNEDLSLGKKINSEKFSAWGTMMAALLTAVTVYLLYLQNKQQLEDRKAATYPDLYPSEGRFEAVDITVTPMTPLVEYGRTYERYSYPTSQRLHLKDQRADTACYVDLCNIGLGAAKEINLKWKYDIKAVENDH